MTYSSIESHKLKQNLPLRNYADQSSRFTMWATSVIEVQRCLGVSTTTFFWDPKLAFKPNLFCSQRVKRKKLRTCVGELYEFLALSDESILLVNTVP